MPYKTFTKQEDGKKKYCMTSLKTGKTYCYDSVAKRQAGMEQHEMFSHMKSRRS